MYRNTQVAVPKSKYLSMLNQNNPTEIAFSSRGVLGRLTPFGFFFPFMLFRQGDCWILKISMRIGSDLWAYTTSQSWSKLGFGNKKTIPTNLVVTQTYPKAYVTEHGIRLDGTFARLRDQNRLYCNKILNLHTMG